MIKEIRLKNYGIIEDLTWSNLSKINVIVGANGTGKTFILKSLYSSLKTVETFKKGNEYRSESEILSEKLYWTFQTAKIGNLVTKGVVEPLEFDMDINGKSFAYKFGKDTTKNVTHISNNIGNREANTIFIPAKEVLTLQKIIIQTKEFRNFGFDETYYDLAMALQYPKTKGKSSKEFSESRKILEELLDGKVEIDPKTNEWIFKKGNQVFSMGVTAEGIKKIAILDQLLGNRYLSKDSIIIIDEPEAGLHPYAIIKFMEIIKLLSDYGVQIFIATHSYFAIKKLCIIAKKQGLSIPFLSLNRNEGWVDDNLMNGMPDNEIINESVNIYKEEIESTVNKWTLK